MGPENKLSVIKASPRSCLLRSDALMMCYLFSSWQGPPGAGITPSPAAPAPLGKTVQGRRLSATGWCHSVETAAVPPPALPPHVPGQTWKPGRCPERLQEIPSLHCCSWPCWRRWMMLINSILFLKQEWLKLISHLCTTQPRESIYSALKGLQ